MYLSAVTNVFVSDTPACDICDKELSTWAGVKRRKICYHTEEKYHESEKSEKDVEFKEGPPKHKLEHSNNEEQTYEVLFISR